MLRSKSKQGLIKWSCTNRMICGGNGDRIRGIGNALYHALRLNYDLEIVWNVPVEISEVFHSAEIAWEKTQKTNINKHSHIVVHAIDGKKIMNPCNWSKYNVIELTCNYMTYSECDHSSRNKELWKLLFQGDFAIHDGRFDSNPKLGCVFWYLFRLKPPLQKLLAVEFEKLYQWRLNRNMTDGLVVGVHYRSGDQAANFTSGSGPGDVRSTMEHLDHQIHCANKMIKMRNISTIPTIVLCTDNVEAKNHAAAKYQNVYSSSIKPYHVDKPVDSNSHHKLEGTLGSWVDIFLLASLDGLVLSPSGFAVLAGEIGMYDQDSLISFSNCLKL